MEMTISKMVRLAKTNNETLFDESVKLYDLFQFYDEDTDIYLKHKYGSRQYFSDEESEDDILESFRKECDVIINHNLDNYDRIVAVIRQEYNPLENLDAYEEFEGTETDTDTYSGKEKTTLYNFPDDSETLKETDINMKEFNARTDTHAKTFNNRVNHRHGNQGVTKSQEMLIDEVNVRIENIMLDTISNIVVQLTY